MVLAADNTCTGAIIRDTREFNIYTRVPVNCCSALNAKYVYKYFLSKIHNWINARYLHITCFLFLGYNFFKSKREIYLFGEGKFVA